VERCGVFFDALRLKIRDESVVQGKAVYLALAIDPKKLGASVPPSDPSRTGALLHSEP